jgi:hypothetical protein
MASTPGEESQHCPGPLLRNRVTGKVNKCRLDEACPLVHGTVMAFWDPHTLEFPLDKACILLRGAIMVFRDSSDMGFAFKEACLLLRGTVTVF